MVGQEGRRDRGLLGDEPVISRHRVAPRDVPRHAGGCWPRCIAPGKRRTGRSIRPGAAITVVAAILLVWPGQPRVGARPVLSGVHRRRRLAHLAGQRACPAGETDRRRPPAFRGRAHRRWARRRWPPAEDGTSSSSATAPATSPTRSATASRRQPTSSRLFKDLRKDETQTAWYDPGVGTERRRRP